MPVRLRLPRISTQLYGVVALFLAIVYALVIATTQFAGETEDAVNSFRTEALGNVAMTARLQVLLEQHRRLVATAPFAASGVSPQGVKIYRDLNAAIAGMIERMPSEQREKLARRFALLASQGGAVLELAQAGKRDQAVAAAARYDSTADGLTLELLRQGDRRLTGAQASLEHLAARSGTLTTWTAAAAAVAGLVIGPLCLMLLHRMLSRMQGVGSALIRLARNDTSVDIPGVTDQDEFGQLARSVAVFKAKSIELLTKKDDFERLNMQLDAAINTMPLGLSMFDAQERLLMCNRRFTEMYDLPSVLTRPGTALCALREHREKKGGRHSDTGLRQGDGAEMLPSMLVEFDDGRVIEVSRQPLRRGGWVSLHEDITERRRQEERIAYLALHDALTGLANRMLFRQQLEQSRQQLERGRGFAVLCLDLDHFKAVNDTLGHPIGDRLLTEVSKRLASCVRHGDIVARLGGDEFAVLQTRVRDPAQTEVLAARIVETVSAPYNIDGNRIDIGTSIGITLAPRDGTEADTLLKNADLALYRTKSLGRRGFSFFQPEMDEEVQARRSLEIDLRNAIGEDALDLAFQPVVCLMSEQPTAFEAHVRWRHPERGEIPPEVLFTIAEDAGLMSEIGCWALRQSCVHATRWPAAVRVAVNVSSLQFLKRDITETVLQALAETGLSPRRLELEIPEAVLHDNASILLATLHQLRQVGVRIVLDGFGAGRSSLANLRTFAFDKVKIDKTLIADIGRSKEARAIYSSMIALGNSLHMKTVAVGIEDFDQLGRVRGWGCSEAQGFLLGPTMSAASIDSFLRARAGPAQADPGTTRESLNPGSGESAELPESWQAA
jgi:diguanylate cyclase (GGDEF)-like protein